MTIFIKNQTAVNNLMGPLLLASSDPTTWVVLPQGLHKKIVNLFVTLSRVRCYTPIMTIHNALSMCSHTATILCLESQVTSISVRRNRNRCLHMTWPGWKAGSWFHDVHLYCIFSIVLSILANTTGNICLCGFRTPLRYITVSCSSLAIIIYGIFHI